MGISYGMVAGPDQWAAGRGFWGFEPGKMYDASRAVGLLQWFAEERHAGFLNTLEPFREAAKTETLFYAQDGHFTPAGHQVLARAAVPALTAWLRAHRAR